MKFVIQRVTHADVKVDGRRRSDRKDWERIYGADRSGTG